MHAYGCVGVLSLASLRGYGNKHTRIFAIAQGARTHTNTYTYTPDKEPVMDRTSSLAARNLMAVATIGVAAPTVLSHEEAIGLPRFRIPTCNIYILALSLARSLPPLETTRTVPPGELLENCKTRIRKRLFVRRRYAEPSCHRQSQRTHTRITI